MADSRAKHLKKRGDKLFNRPQTLSMWQDIAENFYVERATFLASSSAYDIFADNLTTSDPLLIRRELANQLSSMLRPRGRDWFDMSTEDDNDLDYWARVWLEDKTVAMRRAMYDRKSQFVRHTTSGDHDFATFGQCVLSVDMNMAADGLIYGGYHLKDVAWRNGAEGGHSEIQRKWAAPAHVLVKRFPKTVHKNIVKAADKDPEKTFNVRHCIIPSDEYDTDTKLRRAYPWVSVWYDCEHEQVLEEVGRWDEFYIIPQWVLLSDTPYAFSPCTVIALPEARLMQSMALTLLEAAEKSSAPPMLGRSEVIRGDVQLFADGITWVDQDYDSRFGKALEPVVNDYRGLTYGMDMLERTRQIITECFYLNKLTLPDTGNKTAYETARLVEEYIRNALPLFEPMEQDYNGQLCERTFDVMLRNGGFGSVEDIPMSLRGKDVQFKFQSPLQSSENEQQKTAFLEAKALLREAVELDPSSRHILNARHALREVLNSNIDQDWMRSEEDVEQMAEADAQAAQMQQEAAMVETGAAVAEQVGNAEQSLKKAAE